MEKLLSLQNEPRVTVVRGGAPDPDGKCVAYWMRRSLRARENPSLNTAIEIGNALGKPVVVFFALLPVSNANLRHYTFMVQGLMEVATDLQRRGVGFVLRRYPEHSVARFCQDVRAAALITDENPLRGPRNRLAEVARQVRIPVWSVDSDVVVPTKLIPAKQYAARIIRPKLLKVRDKFLVRDREVKPKSPWRSRVGSVEVAPSCLDGLPIDRSVSAKASIRGGTSEAMRLLKQFAQRRLRLYPRDRNHPEAVGTSHLSPYLHFGQISPVTVALTVMESSAPRTAKEAFLDQLITWRELCINFVRHNDLYDSIECAEPWAQRTLSKHAKDRRPVLYNERQLENAETYDALWNAAQIQMVEQGWMHNYMRMYWGKKILEWTRSPAEAYQIAVRLNDKYEIDGRDPNGYAGIAWAITGKLDRPWFERPIFGQIRYMSGQSTGRKFDSKAYIAQNPPSRTG